ncbi:MAG: BACON domain-containing protein, partial [Alistipes sp.]|nr:BACON domain-containing protein [Alistipes sp.]
MKKLFLLLALVGTIFSACEGGGDVEEENGGGTPSIPKIELAKQSIEVEFEPAEYSVDVTSPYSWKAVSDNDWIVVETKTGIAGTKELSFTVERNEEEKVREGTITVMN